MVIASTGFSKSLVMSVMLCPAHRGTRYSNGIVSPMKAMFVHEIDISGFVRGTSGWIVIFSSRFGIDVYSDPVGSTSMVWIRISHKGRRYVQSSG
jgi:hypothetical protein